LGNLQVEDLPYGGRIETRLVDNGSGVGRLEATVHPNQAPNWEWIGRLDAGFGLGYSTQREQLVAASLRAELLRYKRGYLDVELRYEDSLSSQSYNSSRLSGWIFYRHRIR
jgi:hypothetical protein